MCPTGRGRLTERSRPDKTGHLKRLGHQARGVFLLRCVEEDIVATVEVDALRKVYRVKRKSPARAHLRARSIRLPCPLARVDRAIRHRAVPARFGAPLESRRAD